MFEFNLGAANRDIDNFKEGIIKKKKIILEEWGLTLQNNAARNVERVFTWNGLESKSNVNTGTMQASIDHQPAAPTETVTVECHEKYGYDVEYGTPPGKWVDYDTLELWARRRGVDIPVKVIQRKIYKKGIAPSPFFRPAIEETDFEGIADKHLNKS